MSTIVFDSNESVFYEGRIVYLKALLITQQGTGYLTSKRFVFCKYKYRLLYYGSIIGSIIMNFNKASSIEFEVELTDIKSIQTTKHGFSKKYILKTKNSEEFPLMFFKNPEWLEAFKIAMKNSNKNLIIKELGDLIEFQ